MYDFVVCEPAGKSIWKWGPVHDFRVQNDIHTSVNIQHVSCFSPIRKMRSFSQLCRTKRHTYIHRLVGLPSVSRFSLTGPQKRGSIWKWGSLYDFAVQNSIHTWVVERSKIHGFAVNNDIHTWVGIPFASCFSSINKTRSTLWLCLIKRYTYMSWYLTCIPFFINW